MIKQPARVIAETPSTYQLETLPKSACPRCAEGKGCGGGILAQAFANRTYQLTISKNQSQLKINQLVQIGIHSSVLVRGSLLLYIVPLLLMISSAVIMANLFSNNDWATVIAAALGLLLGVTATQKLSVNYLNDKISSPVIIDDDQDSCWYEAD